MKLFLENRKTIDLILLNKNIQPKDLMKFINAVISEDGYLCMDEKVTLKEEKEWLKNSLNKLKKNLFLSYILIHNEKPVGIVSATPERGRGRNNISLGITISKEFRGLGLGQKLLTHIIEKSKNKWQPKNIFLSVVKDNKPAYHLYKKLGFKEFAIFPKWIKRKKKYRDLIYLLYNP